MEDNKTYKIYSKEEIKGYLQGEMTALEMYALEKQAIEDPFLADAIDGYQTISTDAAKFDVDWLHKNLFEKEAKVFALPSTNNKFPWWKLGIAAAAVGLIVLLGVNLFNKKENTTTVAANQEPNHDSTNKIITSNDTQKIATTSNPNNDFNATLIKPSENTSSNKTLNTNTVFVRPEELKEYYADKDDNGVASNFEEKKYTPVTEDEKKASVMDSVGRRDVAKPSVDLAEASKQNEEIVSAKVSQQNNTMTNGVENDKFFKQAPAPAVAKKEVSFNNNGVLRSRANNNVLRNYMFNYKVVDAQGNQIPFSNISVPADQLVTYSRVDGSFGLFSTDSILNVNIKAAGFASQNIALKYNNTKEPIILKEQNIDDNNTVVVSGYSKNKEKKSNKLVSVIEEVEPADGLNNYDSYIANNINLQEKPKGEVVLSFEVSKNGLPTNIIVDKSLSSNADQEAIRLLTEGPKWKANKRKNRKGKIIIRF